jgi:hypothetical protein
MENLTTYIAYDAGCNIWVVEPFNKNIDWHLECYQGSKKECKEYAESEMEQANMSYNDSDYLIG